MTERFIPPHGGYQNLLSYQKAKIVYDGTVRFCQRFLRKSDRTYDQMVQAARSGKQNILEGSQASGTSKETELKLTNVARSSLEELLEDYRDFLRLRGLKEWANDQGTRFLGLQRTKLTSLGAWAGNWMSSETSPALQLFGVPSALHRDP